MVMLSPTLASINGAAFERQGVQFQHLLEHSNNLDEEDSIIGTLEPKQRLLALTEPQKRFVKVVRKCPGSDAKTIGGVLGLSRYAALAQLKKLASPTKNVLRYQSGNKPNSGAKATFYFFLAEDIPSELVDAVLGSAAVEANTSLDVTNFQSLESPNSPGTKSLDSNGSFESFATLPSPTQELAFAIAKAGDEGISVNELGNNTGQKRNRVDERVKFLVKHEFVSRKTMPGFRQRYVYIATPALKTIVEQLPLEQTERPESTPHSKVDTCAQPLSRTMTFQSSDSSSSQTHEDTLSELQQDIQDIFEVMAEMAQRLKEQEHRFKKLEIALRGKRTLKSADIRAILNSDPRPLS